jgi:hypothetical protein
MTTAYSVPKVVPTVVSFNGQFYEGETTFGREKGWAPFDKKISVPLGKVYLFSTATRDHDGFVETYNEGEIVYVSRSKENNSRQIIKLNRYGARITVALQRQMPGITRTVGDSANFQVALSFVVSQPYQLIQRYNGRLDRLNDEVRDAISEGMKLLFTDDVWRTPYDILLTNVTLQVNQLVAAYGLQVIPAETSLIREYPRVTRDIVDECRLAEHILIDLMDGGRFEHLYDPTLNANRIIEIQKNPLHGFLNEGDITVFVQNVTQSHVARGKSFFELIIDKLNAADDNAADVQHFVAKYAGPATASFVHMYNEKITTHQDVSELSLSADVIRTNFSR